MPLIVLAVLSLSALPALPVMSPLTFAVVERLIPATRLFSIPATVLEGLIVNACAVQIAKAVPLVSRIITGLGSPTESSKEVALALVTPNPATASGPIKVQAEPV